MVDYISDDVPVVVTLHENLLGAILALAFVLFVMCCYQRIVIEQLKRGKNGAPSNNRSIAIGCCSATSVTNTKKRHRPSTGTPVFPTAIKMLHQLYPNEDDKNIRESILELLKQRYTFGLKKYGEVLTTTNGQPNVLNDIEEELGDAAMYITKAAMNGVNITRMAPILEYLNRLYYVITHPSA